MDLNFFPPPQGKPTKESSKPNLPSANFIPKEVRSPELFNYPKILETVGPNGGYQTQIGANLPQEGYPPQERAQQRYYPPQKNADRSQQKTSSSQQGGYPLYEGYPSQPAIHQTQKCYYLSQQGTYLPTYLPKDSGYINNDNHDNQNEIEENIKILLFLKKNMEKILFIHINKTEFLFDNKYINKYTIFVELVNNNEK